MHVHTFWFCQQQTKQPWILWNDTGENFCVSDCKQHVAIG